MLFTTTLYGEVALIEEQTPWRVWSVAGPSVTRGESGQVTVSVKRKPMPFVAENAQLTPPPPATWAAADFDDALWGRYGNDLFEFLGGYGVAIHGDWPIHPHRLCVRTRFGIADPARATDLKATVEFLGGAIVYVNGVEVGRSNLPAGALDALTLAKEYPVAAYTTEDDATPLPGVGFEAKPEAKWQARYETRVRTLTVTIPAKVLVQGANVLAVELRRAPVAGPLGRGSWAHVAIRRVTLTSASGAGAIAYTAAGKGTRVWSAQALDPVTDRLAEKSLIARSWFKDASLRGMPTKGIAAGNPFDPVVPVRIHVPRNGVGHGQVVLTDLAGLTGVRASVNGLTLPVTVKFGAQGANSHWCDELVEQPPASAKTVPVWLQVSAPKNQAPGWQTGNVQLVANGKQFTVPVQVFVSGFTVPDAKDFHSLIGVQHSPDTVAAQYKVAPYSPEHFKLLEKSLALAGQLGNDILYVPVIVGTHMKHETGLIRWVKTPTGLKPDFTLFEKYLDLYLKHCAPPQAISLYVWNAAAAKEVANAYEGRAIVEMAGNPKAAVRVTQWDPATGATTTINAPTFNDEGAAAFWKPFFDGVRASVVQRGWSERIIMLGTGSDTRPSQKTGELLRQWAPYARWDLYSHFSADPGSMFYKGNRKDELAAGKLIAVGDLEIGMKEVPETIWGHAFNSVDFEKRLRQKLEYLHLGILRLTYNEQTGPLVYRTIPCHAPSIARVGLDFWAGGGGGLIWGGFPTKLASPRPAGAGPTVRFTMMCEGMQDYEVRLAIYDALAKMPADQQQRYRSLLDGLAHRTHLGGQFLSQAELSHDWPGYIAQVYRVAAELTGTKSESRWDTPPRPQN